MSKKLEKMEDACARISSKSELGQGEGGAAVCKLPFPNEKITGTSSKAVAEAVLEDVLDDVYNKVTAEKVTPHDVGNVLDDDAPTEETTLLDKEIKQMIKDMKSPPEKIEPVMKPLNKGVGDQLTDQELVIPKDPKTSTLEKKARFTNLVRHSTHNLRRYFGGEKFKEPTDDDKKSEQLLKITELEETEQGTSGAGKSATMKSEPAMSEMELVNLRKGNSLRKRLVKAFEKRSPAFEENPKKKTLAKFFRLLRRNPKEDDA